jgi:hypothetical protein
VQGAHWLPDAAIGYLVYENAWGGHAWRGLDDTVWLYDESLQNRSRTNYGALESSDVQITSVTEETLKARRREVLQERPREYETAGKTIVWWNGPLGQLDVYRVASRRRIRSMGAGAITVDAPARPDGKIEVVCSFPIRESRGVQISEIIVTPQEIYQINAAFDSGRKIFAGSIQGAGYQSAVTKETVQMMQIQEGVDNVEKQMIPSPHPAWICVVSAGALQALDLRGQLQWQLPLPLEAIGRTFSYTILKNDLYGLEVSQRKNSYWNQIFLLLRADGTVVRRVEVNLSDVNRRLNPPASRSWRDEFAGLSLFLPSLAVIKPTACPADMLVGLALAGVIVWLQRRTGAQGWRRVAWPVLTATTGVFGLLVYAAAHGKERTEKCPACGKQRRIDVEQCPHCACMWPGPGRTGMEVFQSADAGLPS